MNNIPFDKMYPRIGAFIDTQGIIPKESIEDPGICRTVYTTIRVKNDDGLWYKLNIAETWVDRANCGIPNHFMIRFYAIVYNYLILYKIDSNTKLFNGSYAYILDDDQRDEKERLKEVLSINS